MLHMITIPVHHTMQYNYIFIFQIYLIQHLAPDKCKMIPICTHFNNKALHVTPYLISSDVTAMKLMVVEEHESFMTEYTSHFIQVYIMSTSV